MSAANRGAERREADFYPTPAWCVHRLLDYRGLRWGRYLEPCVGDGAIVRAVTEWVADRHALFGHRGDVEWTTVDIRPECEGQLIGGDLDWEIAEHITADFTWFGCPELGDARFDVCLTNPPYALAEDFVRQALRRCDEVAMLLRLNWLASERRADWLRDNTPTVYVLPNRPNFLKGEINPKTGEPFGGDATDYAWMVWGDTEPGVHILGSTPEHLR